MRNRQLQPLPCRRRRPRPPDPGVHHPTLRHRPRPRQLRASGSGELPRRWRRRGRAGGRRDPAMWQGAGRALAAPERGPVLHLRPPENRARGCLLFAPDLPAQRPDRTARAEGGAAGPGRRAEGRARGGGRHGQRAHIRPSNICTCTASWVRTLKVAARATRARVCAARGDGGRHGQRAPDLVEHPRVRLVHRHHVLRVEVGVGRLPPPRASAARRPASPRRQGCPNRAESRGSASRFAIRSK